MKIESKMQKKILNILQKYVKYIVQGKKLNVAQKMIKYSAEIC